LVEITDSGKIICDLKTKSAPNMEAFHIYVFSDKFRNNLIACARIEVYSMTYFKIKTKAGVEKPFELTFTSGSDYPACTV
jgi:hypothetical protein